MKKRNLFQEFIQYVTLNICGMLGLSCYILADTFFISKGLGTAGLTALNLAIPVYSFVHGSGLMLGMGGATKYSIFRGQKEGRNANDVYTVTLYAAAGFAALFVLIGIFLSGRLTALLGADRKVFEMTNTYIRFILLFAPAFIANDSLLCFVRNDGNPKLAMTAMLAGSLSNIALDYVFIFPLDMGIGGAVFATGLAPVISLLVLSRHWIKRRNQFHFQRNARSLPLIKTVLSLGIPSLVTEVASGIVIIVFNAIILRLEGNTGVAAYGVVANLSLVVTSVYTGIAQGTQPIFSRLYGYGEHEKIRQVWRYAILTTLSLSCFIYLLFFSAAGPITGIFNSEQNMQLKQLAETGLKLYFIAAPFAGFNILLSTRFTSTEQALPAQVISLARGLFVIVPAAFLMSALFRMPGVWLSYPLTEGIVALAGVLYRRRSLLARE